MRDLPGTGSDPYATLGLERGATMPEVKRAYRRLAKAFHPDSAGEAALPRFLAIHEAYEAIRTGRPMARARGTAPAASSAAEPWRADPARARAARDRSARRGATGASSGAAAGARTPGANGGPASTRSGARAGGTGSARASSGGGPGARGATGATGARGGAGGASGAGSGAGSAGRTGTTGGTRGGGRRHVRKATMGSTSYDDARDPNDATWSGASWYGPSTGEYWIVNPREYADPRKHGPEYQSRARRPLGAADDVEGIDEPASEPRGEPEAQSEALGQAAAAGSARARATRAGGAARDAATRARATGATTADATTAGAEATWAYDRPTARTAASSSGRAEPVARPDRARRGEWSRSAARLGGADGPVSAGPAWDAAWPGDPRSFRRVRGAGRLGGSPGEWIGATTDDPVRRLGIALLAWPPVGLAAAGLIGDLTGCSVYSAECGGTEPLLPWLAQAVILGLLLLLPPMARILAGGSIGVLFALMPATAFLVAVGGAGAPQAGFALTFFLALAWLAGVGWAMWRQLRPGPARAAP